MRNWRVIFITLLIITSSGFSNASNLIFDAEFDKQPDWENTRANQRIMYPGDVGNREMVNNLPGKFDSFYTSERWHENGGEGRSRVFGKQPVAQINNSQARQEGGKSFLIYDESYGGPSQWGSDAQIGKDLPENYQELWVEFYIKFQKDWVWKDVLEGEGQSVLKLFRARHVPDNYFNETRYNFFGNGGRAKSPVYMIDLKSWSKSDFSVARLKPFIRGFTPQELIGLDDNYFLKDYETESSINQHGKDPLSFAAVFQTGEWVKINIRIKMDSSPGAGDGIEEVWINDVLEKSRYDIPFRRKGEGEGVGFNWFSIGGNGHNYPFPDNVQHEQWYAITDLKIYDGKPDIGKRPKAPSGLSVE